MGALAMNRPVPNTLQQRMDMAGGVVVDMIVKASVTIYEGAFVGVLASTPAGVYGIIQSDGQSFAGIALEKVVSTATVGAFKVRVYVGGYFQHAIGSIATADIGKVVCASDDQTLTITTTNNVAVGRIISVPATGTAIIKMKTLGEISGAVGTTYTPGIL